MEMKLYQTYDNENVINKDLLLKYTIDIKLKAITDISTPIIVLNDKKTMDFTQCNYCYLEEFKRYYFIRSLESRDNNNWTLSLECDVLESFKDDILNSVVEVNRGLKQGEYYQTSVKVETLKDIDIYESDVTLKNEKNVILTTLGG